MFERPARPLLDTACAAVFVAVALTVAEAALLLPRPAEAQQAEVQRTASLRVLVTSAEDGNPIVGANALLAPLGRRGESGRAAGVSDADGYVFFAGTEPGRYRLTVSFVGHRTFRDTLRLRPGEEAIRRVTLAVATQRLDEVVVREERDITTGQAGVRSMTGTDIERVPSPGPTGDLAAALQTQPGVVTVGDRGGDFYIRGGTPSQNTILVDDIPVVKPFHISNLFSAFPSEMVQNADLYAGGFGAEYLGATSGVLDVKVEPGNLRQVDAVAAAGPYLSAFQAEGPIRRDRSSLNVMGRVSTIRQTAPTLTSRRAPFDFYDVLGRYSLQGEDLYCNATGLRTHDSGQISPGRDLALSWSNTAAGLSCRSTGAALPQPFDATIGYSHFQNSEGPVGGTAGQSAGLSQFFLTVDLKSRSFGLPVDYGFTAKILQYSASLSQRFAFAQSFDRTTDIFRGYVATELSLGENLTAEPSLGSQYADGALPTLEPRLRMAYRPGGGPGEISLALGRYAQLDAGVTDERDAGTVFTVFRPRRDEAPLPSARHVLLGYRHRFGPDLEVNLEGYLKAHRNLPVSKWSPAAQLTVETARADGRAYGADLQVEYTRSPLYLSLGYGWSKVRYEAASDDLGAWVGDPVFRYAPAHDRRHAANLVATYDVAGFTARLRWEAGSGRPYTRIYGFDLALSPPREDPLEEPGRGQVYFSEPYGARLPPYHRLDVSLGRSVDLSSRVSLDAEVGVINAYNRDNIFYYDVEALQRRDQSPILPYLTLRASTN